MAKTVGANCSPGLAAMTGLLVILLSFDKHMAAEEKLTAAIQVPASGSG